MIESFRENNDPVVYRTGGQGETMPVITVTALNTYVRSVLDENENLKDIFLRGEISNYRGRHASGHYYFTLKDENSSISAAMFAGNAARMRFAPENGMKIVARGNASIYPKTGQYQFYITEMRPDGEGDVNAALQRLKKKLAAEGIFDPDHKKPLPDYPQRIGVITSGTGAAIEDICKTLASRYPMGEVVVAPVTVQGIYAPAALKAALQKMDRLQCADVIIIGRGGGSAEDLWAFNDEQLVRAVYACQTPVVSAVGHQVDVSLCDYVADVSVATPLAAAAAVCPDQHEMENVLLAYRKKAADCLRNRLNYEKRGLELLSKTKVLRDPKEILNVKHQYAVRLKERLDAAYQENLSRQNRRFVSLAAALDALSPLKVLSRGYSVTTKEGKAVVSLQELQQGDRVEILLSDGSVGAVITERKVQV